MPLPLQHSTAKVTQVVTFGIQDYPSFVMLEFQDFSSLTTQQYIFTWTDVLVRLDKTTLSLLYQKVMNTYKPV